MSIDHESASAESFGSGGGRSPLGTFRGASELPKQRGRIGEFFHVSLGWQVAALGWAAWLALMLCVFAFRAFSHSSLARLVEFKDIPFLAFMMDAYQLVAWLTGVLGFALAFLALTWWYPRRGSRVRRAALALSVGGAVLGAWLLRYTLNDTRPEVAPTGVADWALVAYALAGAWVFALLRTESLEPGVGDTPPARPASAPSLSTLYLFGCAAIVVVAINEHRKFFDKSLNGGFDYVQFLGAGEIPVTKWVLVSISLLFASLATAAALGFALAFRALGRREHETSRWPALRRRAALLAAAVGAALTVPWLAKISTEIAGEGSVLFPVMAVVGGACIAMPLLMSGACLLELDLDRAQLNHERFGASERALTWLLAPIYALVRMVLPSRRWSVLFRMALVTLTLLSLAGLLFFVHRVEDLYEFEDWRGAFKSGLFPALRVLVSLGAAGAVFVYLGRLAARAPGWLKLGHRWGARLAAAGVLVLSTWPLWGWGDVPRNVHARALEFSTRHKFERRFLCWLFDLDRDGYSSVLGGGDADDTSAQIQGAGLPPLVEVDQPEDEFVVADRVAASAFPNLVVLTLEGVTPQAITAYGQRSLGRSATPHLDALAERGARFTRAYCPYPSTWDGWFAINAGRTLSIQEFDSSLPFGDRYTRYNNLQKVLSAVGVERLCYPDASPFMDLFAPEPVREGLWEKDLPDTTSEEDKQQITRGDKRTDRLVRFIESLQPGERFYLSEHLADTHFPWTEVSRKRAKELGYPEGLDWAGKDAFVAGTHIPRLAAYYQQVTRMDTQIGRVVNALKKQGVLDQTLIVVISDHGCQWYEHEHCYYVSHLYEQCLRIPMILAGPGVKGGTVVDAPVVQMDLVASLAEMGGLTLKDPSFPLEGRSLVPLLRGEPVTKGLRERYKGRDLLLKTHYDMLGVIEGFRYKLVVDRPTGARWLYDLQTDPGELTNLIDTRPELEARLSKRLRELVEERMVFLGGIKRSKKQIAGQE